MSFQVNVPPSVLAKAAISEKIEDGDNGEEKTKKREDYKKLKELEEARKAGTAPAMKDEEGKDINPHIPQYIMQAPWYFGASSATLRHQRQQDDKIKTYDEIGAWYKRGVKEGPVSTKYRKGACENCGALTHKKKDCLERPRRLGAKYTGSDIAPDEYLQSKVNLDYEGKRDRWNGYSIDEHKRIFEEYQKMEEAKKILKAQKLEDSEVGEVEEKPEELDDEDRDDIDEDKYAEDMDMPGHKFEAKQRITVRNLRIREDTAKYLYNLDVNSAYYDPKTRSMRENPFQEKDPTKIPFAGDNFARMTGDAMGIANRQMFAWEAYEKGADVNLQADPTKLEVLNKEYQKRKEDFKTKSKDSVLEKYGGEEHLEAPPKQLLLAQTEDYVEYSRHGTVIKGQEKACVKSRYEEDVFLNNHTSVWGSYWKDGKWGFHCCHSTIKESYCTGEAGIEAATTSLPAIEPAPPEIVPTKKQPARQPSKNEEELKQASIDEERQALIERIEAQKQKVKDEKQKRKKKKDKKKKKKKDKKKRKKKKESSSDSSSSSSEDEDAKREERIKKAMEEERKRVKRVDHLLSLDERKRPYNSMFDVHEPTEEEVEAFKRTRKNPDDPMANFM